MYDGNVLFFVAALMFGAVGAVIGGTAGFLVGFVVPVIYGWQMRRVRGRRGSTRF